MFSTLNKLTTEINDEVQSKTHTPRERKPIKSHWELVVAPVRKTSHCCAWLKNNLCKKNIIQIKWKMRIIKR